MNQLSLPSASTVVSAVGPTPAGTVTAGGPNWTNEVSTTQRIQVLKRPKLPVLSVVQPQIVKVKRTGRLGSPGPAAAIKERKGFRDRRALCLYSHVQL